MGKKKTSTQQQATTNAPEDFNLTGRAWFGTTHIGSLEKLGLSKEQYMDPETVANYIKDLLEESGQGREAGVVVCESAEDTFHLHWAMYCKNNTTFKQVAKIIPGSHVEPQKGTKKQLTAYLRKEPPYDEKGEKVLYELGLDCIKDAQGKRSDIEQIEKLLKEGKTPSQILATRFSFRKYENMIKAEYIRLRMENTPVIKDMYNEYHFGDAGSGKTYTYKHLCDAYGRYNVYMVSDYSTGGFDKYMDKDAPPILFLDELKGSSLRYENLLSILDVYSEKQVHSRYTNTPCLWTKVFMTSIYPIEELYKLMVEYSLRKTDGISQLLRRINTIVYHYVEDGEYKTFSIPASEYKDYNDMMAKLHKATDGFQKVSPSEMSQIPFDTEEGH